MPLARIFTHHPERTTALREELQQQGYQVEVRNPSQLHLPPADLEIEFDICDRADALERAASLAEELQADVAVASGVLQPVKQSAPEPLPEAAQKPAQEPVIKTAAQEPAAHVNAQPTAAAQDSVVEIPAQLSREDLIDDRERAFEAAFTASSMAAEEQLPPIAAEEHLPPMIENPVVEYAPLPPVAFADEPSPMRAEPVASAHDPAEDRAAFHAAHHPAAMEEAPRPADPVPYLAQLQPFSPPAARANAEEETGRQHEAESEAARAATPGIGRSAASIFSTAMAGAKSASASTAESFRGWLQEYRKRGQVRAAEARAARVARMLDLEQRKAEAQQRAAELEAAREAAAARLVELVRQREPGLPKDSLPRESWLKESLPRESFSRESLREEARREERKGFPPLPPRRTPVDSLRHASIAGLRPKQRRPLSPQLRAILTGAAAVSVLFVIGIVLGELYPRAPIAHPADHASSNSGVTMQTGSAPVQTGGVTVQTAAPAQPAATAAKPKPSVSAAQTPAQEKPSPRVNTARRIAQQQGEEEVGEDVVVRHYSQPVPTQKPKQSGQQAGLKHFSDMDQ